MRHPLDAHLQFFRHARRSPSSRAARNGCARCSASGAVAAGEQLARHGDARVELKSKAALNGSRGVVDGYDAAQGRHAVAVDGEAAPLALKRENLLLRWRLPLRAGGTVALAGLRSEEGAYDGTTAAGEAVAVPTATSCSPSAPPASSASPAPPSNGKAASIVAYDEAADRHAGRRGPRRPAPSEAGEF